MSDSTNPIDQVSQSAIARETKINDNFDAASPAMNYGRRASTCSGLTWGYYGGRWGGFSIANGTTTLTDNATTYMVVTISSGAVSFSTSSTNWNNTSTYARAYKIVAASGVVTYEDHRAGQYGTVAGGAAASVPKVIQVACSDQTTAITTGTAVVTFRMPYAMTLTAVRASLNTASSSGTPTIDINEAGVSILSTKLTIDASEKTSTTAATAAVISDSALADDAEITIDIDTAGTGAKGLVVTLIGT